VAATTVAATGVGTTGAEIEATGAAAAFEAFVAFAGAGTATVATGATTAASTTAFVVFLVVVFVAELILLVSEEVMDDMERGIPYPGVLSAHVNFAI